MDSVNQKIKEILLRENYVSQNDIDKALDDVKQHGGLLIDYLFSSGLINKDLLGQAVAEALGLPYADLDINQPTQEQVLLIPAEIAQKYKAVLYHEGIANVMIASDNPSEPGLLESLKKVFPFKNIILAYGFTKDIEKTFVHYRDPLVTRLARILQNTTAFAPEIIDEILKEVSIERVSDIHFEPQETQVEVRFRVDGVLHHVGSFSRPLYENIINRIKVKSHLRIDEHNSPQDGAMRVTVDGKAIDLRVSIVPTLDGEKVAIRVLSQYLQELNINDLGLSKNNLKLLFESAQKPFGMIVVTGPTGSGKTTTLYSLIKTFNRPDVNITTIEDPVEYKIPGVNQIQVNEQTNVTFASGLRSIIRQDPNIILVGEVRDLDTAEIAVNAALTGHLLFTTFHANDAATTIPRLLDMGVEPFLMASTLELVVAQRLVRKICNSCKFSQTYTNLSYFPGESVTLYRGKGCKVCGGTGFKGRTGIFEIIKVRSEIQELMLNNPSNQQIRQVARKEGMVNLFEDGLDKVKAGITTLEEVLRVASPRE